MATADAAVFADTAAMAGHVGWSTGGSERLTLLPQPTCGGWPESPPSVRPSRLPRTVVPVAGEYHLDYVRRLAEANHLEFLQLCHALDTPGGTVEPRR